MRKNQHLRCWGWLSLLNWIWALTLSLLLKPPSRKLELWFALWSLFLLKLLFISLNLPFTHTWNIVGMSELVHLVVTCNCYKLQKQICRTVGPSLVTSCEPFAHRWNVVSLSLFYRYYFGRCSSDLTQLLHFLSLEGSLLIILIYCVFLSRILDVTSMPMSTVSFLAQLDSGILCL